MNRPANVLILEDDPDECLRIERELRRSNGDFHVERVERKYKYLDRLRSNPPDVILSSLALPLFDGVSAMLMAQENAPHIPFILLADNIGHELTVQLLQCGAAEVVPKSRLEYLTPALRRVTELLDERDKRQNVEKIHDELQRSLLSERESLHLILKSYVSVLTALANTILARDSHAATHTENMVTHAVSLARALNLPEDRVESVRLGALLYDIGKVIIPDTILKNPARFLEPARAVVRHHHEHWDGTGQPDGLKGEEIPLDARIVTIADAYAALTTARTYRPAKTPDVAVGQLQSGAGTRFDPHLVEVFVKTLQPS